MTNPYPPTREEINLGLVMRGDPPVDEIDFSENLDPQPDYWRFRCVVRGQSEGLTGRLRDRGSIGEGRWNNFVKILRTNYLLVAIEYSTR